MVRIFRYAGFGKETKFGSPVAPTFFIAPNSISMDAPTGATLKVPSGMARTNRKKKPGYYVPKGGIEYNPDFISLGWFYNWCISGGYVFTAGSGGSPVLNTHEIYGDNTNVPDSFSLHTGKDVFEHSFTGTVLNGITMNVSNGLATASLDMLAQMDSRGPLKADADITTLVTGSNLSFDEASCTINGTDQSTWVKSFQVAITNNMNTDVGQTIGSRFPRRFRSAGRNITFNIQLLFEDMDMFDLYWGDDEGPHVDGSSLFALKPKFAIGDQYIEYHLPQVEIDSIQTQPSGTDVLLQTISGSAYLAEDVVLKDTSTVDTDILITIVNSQTTMA